MTQSPATGDIAPDFALPRDGGAIVTLAELTGRKVVIFVYAEDGTPSCTTEAKSFSDLMPAFAASGTAVYGLSQDPLKKHDKFIAKQGLQVPLLSDEHRSFIDAYGLWVEKQMYGKTYMGVERATFLIGPGGRVAQVWHNVRVKDHAAQVLAAAQALG
jgi:thioredoxin-dependent peroxiredoxin